MDRSRLDVGHSSAYGQACIQCYKAKCRCVPNADGGGRCERCYRLRKECRPSDSARRRNAQRSEESDVRIAQLEGKVESLLSAVQSMVNSSGTSSTVFRPLDGGNTPSPAYGATGPVGVPTNPTNFDSHMMESLTPPKDTLSAGQQLESPFAPPSLPDPSPWLAEEHLTFFRSRMLPCFPFLFFTPDTTAAQLRQDRPTLFQAILAVTTFSTQERLARVEHFKRLLIMSSLINIQSNMDLLLGILTYLAWSTDVFLGRADLVSRLTMLSISLVYDLRLFKPSQPDVQLTMTITQGTPYVTGNNPGEETLQSSMERHRALLACFILSSNTSTHLGRQDALRWTPQMEEALRVVERSAMSPTDEAFAFHVRLHVLKQKAACMREQRETNLAPAATAPATTSLSGLLYLKSLRGQLHDLVSSFPPRLHQKHIFVTYAQDVELYMNQLAYSMSWGSPLLNLAGQPSGNEVLPGFERLQCLWQSVENIRSWRDNFCNIDPSDLLGLPSHFWSHMIMCITILKYLSILKDPDWDCQAVRNTVNLVSTVECIHQRLELGCHDPALPGDDNLLKLLLKLLSKCQGWAEAWMNAPPETPAPGARPWRNAEAGVISSDGSSIPDLDQMVIMHTMNLESDQWFEDLLRDPGQFS